MSTRHLDDLRAQAQYARQRYDLYKAKAYGQRPTSLAHMRELERASERAEARLRAAEAQERRAHSTEGRRLIRADVHRAAHRANAPVLPRNQGPDDESAGDHDPPRAPRDPCTDGRATKEAIVNTLESFDVRRQRAELVGARIRLARRANGLSRLHLASLLDDTTVHISRWELGRHEPNAFNLQRLSEVLEVPLWFFFGGPPAGG